MATIIRQEINLLNGTIAADADASEMAQINTAYYSGSCLYYFEVVGKRASGTCTVTLHDASNNVMATCSVTGTTDALVRSTAFTPTAGAATYHVNLAGGSTTPIIKAARVVVIQTSTPLTATETQIEIGGRFSSTSTTGSANGVPKYWKYTSANWDGTLAVYFEAVFKGNTTKSSVTVKLQVADGSGDGFLNWTDVTNGSVSLTSTTITRVRGTSAITLVAGRNYRIVALTQTTKSACNVYCAKIVLKQYEGICTKLANYAAANGNILGGTGGAGETNQAQAQAFQLNVATQSVAGITIGLAKLNNPTDTLTVAIVSSLGGAALASVTKAASDLTTTLTDYPLTFDSPCTITVNTTYYIQLTRSSAYDATNRIQVGANSSASPGDYSPGNQWTRNNNAWTENASGDIPFLLTVSSGLTKLEPQYLLANAAFAAGTNLQTFLTKWDSAEWSGVVNAYYHYVSSANGSSSDAQLEQADGGGTVTNSEVSNPDNAGMSAAMTMPASENLDVKATTNNGDLYSSRILVACVMSSSSIATWDDLARASWETVMGLAVASVATVDGLA